MSIFRTGTGSHRGGDEEGLGSGPAPIKSVQVLSGIALVIIGGFSSAAIAYASIVKGDSSATALLGTLATAALAALVVLASGVRHSGEDQ